VTDTIGHVPLAKALKAKAEASRLADKYVGKDGGAPSSCDERRLDELAEMSPVEYGRRRGELADKLGTSRGFLDLEYRERRKRAKAEDAEERDAAFLCNPDPWPEPVDGADLLDRLTETAVSHLVLPGGAAETIALWTLFAHAHDCFDISPVLGVTSPTPECGKTSLLTLLGGLVPRALPASNITAAALFRAVEKWTPTLLVDEADTFLRDSDELRGILNSGHQRGSAFVIRTTGENHEPKQFSTWSPKAVALIGKLPPTLASRAIDIKLRRKTATELVVPLRLDRLGHLDPLLRQAARWAGDNAAALRRADPEMPPTLYGRIADNWRPLLAVADVAGGHWPEQARRIAERLSARREEETASIMLLADIHGIFAERGVDRLTSQELVDALAVMEGRPWPEWKAGKPITQTQLAKLLAPFDIVPNTIRTGSGTPKGYLRTKFTDVFSRYLVSQAATTPQPAEVGDFLADIAATSQTVVAARKQKKPADSNACGAVAAENPQGGDSIGDGDPFASLKDSSLKLRVDPAVNDYPDLPPFLDRRET
jgi:putative DNA primase/helicase